MPTTEVFLARRKIELPDSTSTRISLKDKRAAKPPTLSPPRL
jgi:hypothetical protein